MSANYDALKAARAESMHRRPAIASATTTSTVPMGNRQFEGRRSHGNAFKIRIDRITPDPDQPRKTFDPEPLARLAENMRTRGQLVPILVRWNDDQGKYVVIDGERRYRAALIAELPDLAVVLEASLDADTILETQLIANALREDVAPVEQAKAWDRLRQSQGLTYKELGDKLGYEFSTISKGLALLDLTAEIQARVDAGEIAASTAEKIARLDPDEQGPLAARVVEEGLNHSTRSPRGTAPQAKGSAKTKLMTTRIFKGESGLRLTAERSRGIDSAALLDLLMQAAEQIRGEQAPAFES